MPNRERARHSRRRGRSTLVMVVHARYPIAEPRVQREALAARAAGWNVVVISLREPPEPERERVDGVDVIRLPIRHRRGAPFLALAWEYAAFAVRAAWRLARTGVSWQDAVVQVHAPPDFLVFAALVPKLRGARVVLDIHDLSHHMFSMRFRGPASRFGYQLLAKMERLACAFADRVITVHEPYRREIRAIGVPAEKLSVVMNTPDHGLIERACSGLGAPNNSPTKNGSPIRSGARAPGRPAEKSFTIAYHGTLVDHYGVDLLIEAVGRLSTELPAVRAVVLGDGDQLPYLKQRTTALGLDDVVKFSGRYLPIEEALRAVKAASCGVIPNRPSQLNRFALSSKLFEYVELGVPAVVSELPTLRAYFEPGHVRFFAPGNVESLTEALLWVAENPDEACGMAAGARAHARRYSWERNAKRYLEVLDPSAGAVAPVSGGLQPPASGPSESHLESA